MRRTNPWAGAMLAPMLLAGCAGPPVGTPALDAAPAPTTRIGPAGFPSAEELTLPGRYVAFAACRRGSEAGGLFLWDAALQDVYVLNAALAGLVPDGKAVGGPDDCQQLFQLEPRAFGKAKVLFSYGSKVFVYDLVTEERVTAATDGRPLTEGGPLAVVSSDGKLVAYVSLRGTLVLKPTHPVYATKTRELSKLAAELDALSRRKGHGGRIVDLDLSGDGKWLVLNVDGAVYLYDVATPGLVQVAPLDGEGLAGLGDGLGEVAIGPDGNLVAWVIAGRRLLVFDRKERRVDTVAIANLGDDSYQANLLDPQFAEDGRTLYVGDLLGMTYKLWSYDRVNETLRALVTLNGVLGEADVDVRASGPGL